MTQTFTIYHASPEYLIGDILEMHHLGLRPGKQRKDEQRINALVSYGDFKDKGNLTQHIMNIDKRLSTYYQARGKVKSSDNDCKHQINMIEPKIYMHPVDNVSLMKISKVLPLIYDPQIIYILRNPEIQKKIHDDNDDFSRYMVDVNEEMLKPFYPAGIQLTNFLDSKIITLTNEFGINNATFCFTTLTEYIQFILSVKDKMNWGILIGRMVHEYRKYIYKAQGITYQKTRADFLTAPLVLVHIIQMICSGIEFNVPTGTKYKGLQKSLSQFMRELKKLERECYKFQKANIAAEDMMMVEE